VPIRGEGHAAPLVCLPGAGGTVFSFVPLAELLPPGRPIFGLQYPGLDGGEPLDSVDALAEALFATVSELARERPLCLLGYSLGGLVAHELARRLDDAGHKLQALIVADTAARVSLKSRVRAALPAPPKRAPHKRKSEAAFAVIRRMVAAGRRARLRWRPGYYAGRLTLLRGERDAEQAKTFGSAGGWRRFAREVEVVPVAGRHLDLLAPARMPELAERVAALLERDG